MDIYVVQRNFKTNGEVLLAGSIIQDPSKIRLFKSKINEGKIALVNEHNVDTITTFLERRTGTNYKESLMTAVSAGTKVKAPEMKKPEVKTHVAKEPAKVNVAKTATVVVK